MNLNFEIPKEYGDALDSFAKKGHRSRRAQARKMLMEAIDICVGRSVPSDKKEAGQ
jgi:hypothetical protein